MAEIKTLTVNGQTYTVADPDAAHIDDSAVGEKAWSSGQIAQSVANALKGAATGEVVALKDISPLEHEMAVTIDAQGGTVKKLGKNLVNLDAMLNASLTKDENGVYHITGTSKPFTFAIPIPANTPVTFTFVGLDGHNANSEALLDLSKAYTDGTSGKGAWFGVGEKFTNQATLKYDAAFIRFSVRPYNKSEDFWCTFSALQVEIGETATDYEPYKEPVVYTSDGNGAVSIIGKGEAMTLLADSGTTITAEYNRDTNKVIERLTKAIVSLGGSV